MGLVLCSASARRLFQDSTDAADLAAEVKQQADTMDGKGDKKVAKAQSTSKKVQQWAASTVKSYNSSCSAFEELVEQSVAACVKQLEAGAAAVVSAIENELQAKKRAAKS